MTEENFLKFLQHFVKYVKPTPADPVLLLLDNHDSHLAISVFDYASDNGIVMLSFPPHCSHRLQPLDLSVFGPLKSRVAQEQAIWLRNNSGKTMTIYDIPSILHDAWKDALSMRNIISGFEKAGIFPFNPDVFTDVDFAPSIVTDRPDPALSAQRDRAKDPAPTSVSASPLERQLQTSSNPHIPCAKVVDTLPGDIVEVNGEYSLRNSGYEVSRLLAYVPPS
ncbi:uncharacterized protein LOC135155423 [Lytechinus pictus]|uniref:uncharacterized protein LOC135155423 n=1 Tax=Lytechinus pictus TaxID=7653 RepID=UPI0030BA1007